MEYVRLDDKFRLDLDKDNEDISRLYSLYSAVRRKRYLYDIISSQRLAAIKAHYDEKEIEKYASEYLKQTQKTNTESFRDFAHNYHLLQKEIRENFFVCNPLYADTETLLNESVHLLRSPFPDCVVDSTPSCIFMPFVGVRSFDPDPPLFTKIHAPTPGPVDPGPPWATALTLSEVAISARGQGQIAWISASWCFKPPTDVELCGFSLDGSMSIGGFIDNKSGSSVRVQMDAGITQYRIGKPWDEINPAMDIPYWQLRSACTDPNNNLYTLGYVDDIYGLHSFMPLQASISALFAYPNQPANCSCYEFTDDDTFFVGYWSEIDVGDQSVIEFEFDNYGTIVMNRPTVVFYKL